MRAMAREVTDPDGARWRVGRVWFTRRTKWRGSAEGALEATGGLEWAELFIGVPGIGMAIVIAIVGVIAALIAVVFVLPAVLLIVEILFIVTVAALSLFGRVLLRRPWLVRARQINGDREVIRKVVGFRASGEAVDALAERIRQGQPTVTWGPSEPA